MPSTKASFTAYNVVAGLDKLARLPEWKHQLPAEMRQLNAAFTRHAADSFCKRLIASLPPRLFIWLMDSLYVPGLVHHYLFRKRLIASQVMTVFQHSSKRQVIILGAGFDALALRLAGRYHDARFFEIDLPGTQHAKTRILHWRGLPIPGNCAFIAADLSQASLNNILLNDSRFRRDIPTLVILEGVLMYLSEDEAKALFTELRELFTDSLTIIFGANAASDDAGAWRMRFTNALLRRGREATRWYCPSAVMPHFLAELGYELKSWMPYGKLQHLHRPEALPPNIPDEDENYYTVVKMPQRLTNPPVTTIGNIPFTFC